MIISIKINDKHWPKSTKKDYERAVRVLAVRLANSINDNPEKYIQEDNCQKT